MVGEVMELGRGHGCRQEGGSSTGTPGCSRSLLRSLGRGTGVGGVLVDMMKLSSHNLKNMQDPSGIWGERTPLHCILQNPACNPPDNSSTCSKNLFRLCILLSLSNALWYLCHFFQVLFDISYKFHFFPPIFIHYNSKLLPFSLFSTWASDLKWSLHKYMHFRSTLHRQDFAKQCIFSWTALIR